MPCRYDPGPEDYLRDEKQKNEKMKTDLDKLTHENDQLREALLNMINDRSYNLPAPVVEIINSEQIDHRKEDLKRLGETMREDISMGSSHVVLGGKEHNLYELLGRVMTANPEMPLEPQLGFDPDAY